MNPSVWAHYAACPTWALSLTATNRHLPCPEGKLEDLRQEVNLWQSRKRATKRDLRRLLGKISWIAGVVRAARPFMRRVINLLRTVSRPNHHVRVSAAAKQDLKWLATLSTRFNGVTYWLSTRSLPHHAMATDASGSAAATVHVGDYVYSDFTADRPDLVQQPIHVTALYAVLLGLRRWAPLWRNKKAHIFTDNTVAMTAVNKGSRHCPHSLPLLRELYLIMAENNIYVSAKRVDTRSNALADALSRHG